MKKKLLCALVTFVAVIGLFLISALAGGGDGVSVTFDPVSPPDPSGSPSPIIQKQLTVSEGSTLPDDFNATFTATIEPIPATSDNGYTTYSGGTLTGTADVYGEGMLGFYNFTTTGGGEDGTAPLIFTKAGTYGFTVQEVIPANEDKVPNVTYDNTKYTLTIIVEETDTVSVSYKNWYITKNGDSEQTHLTQATFTNTYAETPKVVTGMTMAVVAAHQKSDLPSAIDRNGFSFPEFYSSSNHYILEVKDVTAGGDAWTFANNALLYKIEVKGDPGAQFTVTDNDTTLVYPTDSSVTRTETSVSGGGDNHILHRNGGK